MGIAGDKPRQLAPTVGTTGSGSTDSPAPSPTTAKIDIDTITGTAAPTNVDATTKIDVDTITGTAAPTNIDTTTKIDIDTITGTAAPTNVDATTKIDIDTITGTAAPTNVDATTKIDIDTTVGIDVPAVIDANSAESEVDAADAIVIDNVSPSTAKSAPAANIIDPTSGTTGTVPGGYDMAFGLFNFYVDSNGAMELLSIGESALLMAEATTPPVVGGKPSRSALLAPSEEEPKLKILTPSVGSNDFEDPPPSPTNTYCVDCDAYHYVGAGDFSSHEIAGCEDPRGAQQLSTRRYLSAIGLSTPSRSALHRMTLTTSKGCTRTTHVQMTTTTSTPKLRGKSAIQQALPHIANLPHPARAMWLITILTS
jgi:hypothetical protein